MWEYQHTDELYHYGILGMKWGHRKAKSTSRNNKKTRKLNYSDDYKESQLIKKKKIYQMSNSELRKLNDRQNLERQYNSLNPNAIKKGLIIAGGISATLGTIGGLYNNSKTILKIGKSITEKIIKK